MDGRKRQDRKPNQNWKRSHQFDQYPWIYQRGRNQIVHFQIEVLTCLFQYRRAGHRILQFCLSDELDCFLQNLMPQKEIFSK